MFSVGYEGAKNLVRLQLPGDVSAGLVDAGLAARDGLLEVSRQFWVNPLNRTHSAGDCPLDVFSIPFRSGIGAGRAVYSL